MSALLALVTALATPPTATPSETPAGEAVVLSHLLAPCCFKQTLDVHDSDLAKQLRAEVRARLLAGESAATVEQRLVARYGDGIRAVPLADPTPKAAFYGLGAVIVAGVALTFAVRRRARPGASALAPLHAGHPSPPDDWDAALDEALRDD